MAYDPEDDYRHMGLSMGQVIEQIRSHGPTRVVVGESGNAVGPKRAASHHSIQSDIIFIRDDGWSLGAPHQFRDVAERMWKDTWIAVWNQGDDEPTLL